MNNIAAIWILIVFIVCLFICGMVSGNEQYKFFALGGIATLSYLMILSFFD